MASNRSFKVPDNAPSHTEDDGGEEEEEEEEEEEGGRDLSTRRTSFESSLIFHRKSTTEIEYCIRTTNQLITALHLPITPIRKLSELTMETLVRIHCALLGIRFSEEFIPSANPVEDARRIVLSLKDRFGADKFNALDPARIAKRHPTAIRFLLENFDLISKYPSQAKKVSKEEEQSYVTNNETVEAVESSSSGFETDTNIVINVLAPSSSTLASEEEPLPPPRPPPTRAKRKVPLCHPPNRHQSRSVLKTPVRGRRDPRCQSLPAEQQRRLQCAEENVVKLLVKNYRFKAAEDTRDISLEESGRGGQEEEAMLERIKAMRSQLSESLVELDHDISQIIQQKPPPPKDADAPRGATTASLLQQPFPSSLRWLLPVECRFPEYNKGYIVSRCSNWRRNLRPTTCGPTYVRRHRRWNPPGKKSSSEVVVPDSAIFSMMAHQGSQTNAEDLEMQLEEEEEMMMGNE